MWLLRHLSVSIHEHVDPVDLVEARKQSFRTAPSGFHTIFIKENNDRVFDQSLSLADHRIATFALHKEAVNDVNDVATLATIKVHKNITSLDLARA